MQKIPPNHLVFFDKLVEIYPLQVDLVYAQPDHAHNHFGPIYDSSARLIGHRDMAMIICLASVHLHASRGWTMVIKDCLRPIEAQALMIDTDLVRANPHWLVEPRFLSTPGLGGHPRGMAIDVGALDEEDRDVDFGTPFDYFSSSTDVTVNKAHRQYAHLNSEVQKNRIILEHTIVNAGTMLGFEILPLPHEWWDFRFHGQYTNQFEPISDESMPDGYWVTKQNTVHANCDEALIYIERKLKDKLYTPLSVIGPCARP